MAGYSSWTLIVTDGEKSSACAHLSDELGKAVRLVMDSGVFGSFSFARIDGYDGGSAFTADALLNYYLTEKMFVTRMSAPTILVLLAESTKK